MNNHPYREEVQPCSECLELRRRLARYEQAERELRPHQKVNVEACCIACGDKLFNRDRGLYVRKYPKGGDETFCTGKVRKLFFGGTRELCPPIPHVHRFCGWCNARWLERLTADTKAEEKDRTAP